jgi:excisionase family DNA binding protein
MPNINGPLIRRTIRERGETREDVARDLGITEGSLRNIENLNNSASDGMAEKIAARLELPLPGVLDAPERPQKVVSLDAIEERISFDAATAAFLVGCKPSAIRQAIRSGALPAAKPGQGYVIIRSDLSAWIERLKQDVQEHKFV